MKNTKNLNLLLSEKLISKWFLIVMVMFSLPFHSQSNEKINTIKNVDKTDYLVEYFKVMEVDNKLYFKFLIRENKNNIVYVLESSVNGSDFSSLQLMEGFKSPNQVSLLYCYQEPFDMNDNTLYRIKRISFDGFIGYSGNITINSMSKSNYWINCDNLIVKNQEPILAENQASILEKSNEFQEDELSPSISIYPNPNNGFVNINFGETKEASIKVYNSSGKMVHQTKNISTPIYQFDINEGPGFYIAEINIDGSMKKYILVKK